MHRNAIYRAGRGIYRQYRIGTLSAVIAVGVLASLIVLNTYTSALAATDDYYHELVSKDVAGNLGNDGSSNPSLSGDGRYVAFDSTASNLVPGDTNGQNDIFVRDRQDNLVKRISVSTDGTQANAGSSRPEITDDGRYVVFESYANNLVVNDTNGTSDVFVHDLQSGITKIASTNSDGVVGNLASQQASISSDGRYVAFMSSSSNLVPNFNPYVQTGQIFAKDMITEEVKLLSVAPDGNKGNLRSEAPRVSCDGNVVVFASRSTNLATNTVADPPNIYQKEDIFIAVKQGDTYQLTEITNNANHHSGSPKVSCDGQHVVFVSSASNIVANDNTSHDSRNVFSYNVASQQFTKVSLKSDQTTSVDQPTQGEAADISNNGKYVVFQSWQSYLDPTQLNNQGTWGFIYVRDTELNTTRMIPVNAYGKSVGASSVPAISNDGSFVSYGNNYYNLSYDNTRAILPEDNTGYTDVYVSRNVAKPKDTTAPIVVGQPSRQPDSGTWYNHDVTINWEATDPAPSSGTPTVPQATVAGIEGQDVEYTSQPSCDPAGNCAAGTYTVSLDKTAPTLGAVVWSANPKAVTGNSTLSVPASDSLSGVVGGEYFIGTDPGQGNGATMTLSGSDLTTAFGTDFTPGVYEMGVRAKDAAGNWSAASKTMLVVYDAAGPGVTGKNKKDFVPQYGVDVLPGLVSATQTDPIDYGFTVAYRNGSLSSNNDLQFVYSTGSKCNTPNASNCHTFAINAIGFSWLVVDQANNSRARFQGVATVAVDGVTTTNPFTVTAMDGDLTMPAGDDTLAVQVYAPGADPATATPLYKVSGLVAKSNGVTVR